MLPTCASLLPRVRTSYLPAAASNGVTTLGVNETWNRTTARDLVKAFEDALA